MNEPWKNLKRTSNIIYYVQNFYLLSCLPCRTVDVVIPYAIYLINNIINFPSSFFLYNRLTHKTVTMRRYSANYHETYFVSHNSQAHS